ncbi:MAG: hypothetical protein C4316_01125 [Chloroflexota bacterium]
MVRRSLLFILPLVVAAAVTVTALRLGQSPADTLVEGIVGTPTTFNPLVTVASQADLDVAALIYDGLVRIDPTGRLIPGLAVDWAVGEDGRTVTFRLREGVRWHDGQPFTAADVAATVKLIQATEAPVPGDLSGFWRSVQVEVPDERTLKVTLKQPLSTFLGYATFKVLPAHRLAQIPPREAGSKPLGDPPVGTGPFRVAEVRPRQLTLEPNPEYFLGRPRLRRIVLRFFPDETGLKGALRNGQVDAAVVQDPSDLPVGERGSLAHYRFFKAGVVMVLLNHRSPILADRSVREAIALSLDRTRLARRGGLELGLPADGPIPPFVWFYRENFRRWEYNPERAQQLLEEAGWKVGADGIREKEGARLAFSLITNDDPVRVAVAEEVVRQLRRVGVEARLSVGGFSGVVNDFVAQSRFEAALVGLEFNPGFDFYSLWHSGATRQPGLNFGQYASSQVDDLLGRIRTTWDPAQQAQLYAELQAALAQDVPGVPLYFPVVHYVADARLGGIRPGVILDAGDRFRDVIRWEFSR